MQIAVVSDIHSNLAALETVLAAIDQEEPDEIWCLGDVVGYGPKPNECCALVRARADICLGGNHDLAVRGTIDLDEFSGDAAVAARWTAGVLTEESLAFLEALEPQGERAEHRPLPRQRARPGLGVRALRRGRRRDARTEPRPIVLVGHSHVALEVQWIDDALDGGLAPAGTEVQLDGRVLLNPGSVGQPRDGDPRAAYLLLDLDGGTAAFHRVVYDVDRTQAEMREAQLPEALAARLLHGE